MTGQLDTDVDTVLDAALERVHALVAAKLVGESAFGELEAQAADGTRTPVVAERTRRRVELALEDAADSDERFAEQLTVLVDAVRQAERDSESTVPSVSTVASGERSVAIGGNNSGIIATGNGLPGARQP